MPFYLPDPDYPAQQPSEQLAPCIICSTLTAATPPLCATHALLAVLAELVAHGAKSDWLTAKELLPSHRFMMTSLYMRRRSTWRAELAALLATHGVWLDDWRDAE